MKYWKVDTKNWTVREVEGEPWPGIDADGETCFSNTHFPEEAKAWDHLSADVSARVSLAGSAVKSAEVDLDLAQREAAGAARDYAIAMRNIRARKVEEH